MTDAPTLRDRLDRFVPAPFTEMDRRSVGIVAVTGIAAACVLAFSLGQLGLLEDRYTMTAVLEDAAGLKDGSLVRLAGVDVGEVTGIDADRAKGQVVVTFEVDEGTRVGSEATAEVALSTLLGGEYIRLGGVVEAPYMEDLSEEERRIPLSRTDTPFSVSEAFNEATDAVEAIDTETVNDLVTEFADIADGSGPRVERVLRGLRTVARVFNEREGVVRDLVEQSQVLTETLADKDETLVELIDAADVVLTQIDERRDELAAVLGDGSSVVRTMANLITERRAELDTVLDDLDVATDVVARRQDDVDTLLAWSGPTYQQVSRIAANGPYIDSLPITLGPSVIGVLSSLYPQLGLDGSPLPASQGGGQSSGGAPAAGLPGVPALGGTP